MSRFTENTCYVTIKEAILRRYTNWGVFILKRFFQQYFTMNKKLNQMYLYWKVIEMNTEISL